MLLRAVDNTSPPLVAADHSRFLAVFHAKPWLL